MFSFGHCPNYLQFGQVVQLFLDVKNNVFAHITEPSNDDYDNDGSDNCDHNFGTFDDFGVKNDQKVSHNMMLMSKYNYKVKRGRKIRAGVLDVRSTPFLYLYLSLCVTLSSPDDSRCCFVSNNVMGPT